MSEDPTNAKIFREIVSIKSVQKEMSGKLDDCLVTLNNHHVALYGPPNRLLEGLVWKVTENEREVSKVKKLLLIAIPSTITLTSVVTVLVRVLGFA